MKHQKPFTVKGVLVVKAVALFGPVAQLWVKASFMFLNPSQAGIGAKAKNLLDLKKEYKGVSWRFAMCAVIILLLTLIVSFYK